MTTYKPRLATSSCQWMTWTSTPFEEYLRAGFVEKTMVLSLRQPPHYVARLVNKGVRRAYIRTLSFFKFLRRLFFQIIEVLAMDETTPPRSSPPYSPRTETGCLTPEDMTCNSLEVPAFEPARVGPKDGEDVPLVLESPPPLPPRVEDTITEIFSVSLPSDVFPYLGEDPMVKSKTSYHPSTHHHI